MLTISFWHMVQIIKNKIQEAKDLIEKMPTYLLLEERRALVWSLAEELREKKDKAKEMGGDTKELYLSLIVEPLEKELRLAQMRLNSPRHKNSVDLEALKEIPITDILSLFGIKYTDTYNKRIKFSLRHDEKIPSAVGYLESNSWYDFGINTGGSVIDLLMFIEECSFKEAVDKLVLTNQKI